MLLYMVEKLVAGVIVLDLRGRIVLGSETEALRERVKRLLEAGHSRILLNLEEVSFIDSSGLSTLVSCFASVSKQGGELKLLSLNRRVHDLLAITKLSTVFDIYDSQTEALRSFSSAASS